LRCIELIRAGKNSFYPDAPTGESLVGLIHVPGFMTTEETDIDRYFVKARAAASAWHQSRTEFMIERLKSGQHPDTNSKFWDGYTESPSPTLPNGLFGLGAQRVNEVLYVVVVIAAGAVLVIGVLWIMRRARKRRVQRAIASA
jgi:hypothetical protein